MERLLYLHKIKESFSVTPACALLGPRQCGKTTLAHQYINFFKEKIFHFFDLEDPTDLAKLSNPKLALEPLEGLIIIDEIQRRPDLFPVLRVLIDRFPKKFLILGSASQELIKQSSETLAGRLSYIELTPFSLYEVPNTKKLWLQGGFPPSYLASTASKSYSWRKSYVRTFLEQDIRNFGFNISAQSMGRFWRMLAHYHGQLFNASELGVSLDLSHKTISHYLDILVETFMLRRLSPWFENLHKRQIKSPKVFFRDSGLFHYLLGIEQDQVLFHHSKIGASWEGFALEEVIRSLDVEASECYFWRTQAGAELDLLILKGDKKFGFEFKYTDTPKITKSMYIALEDLNLTSLKIIVPGKMRFFLSEKVEVFGLENFVEEISSSSM